MPSSATVIPIEPSRRVTLDDPDLLRPRMLAHIGQQLADRSEDDVADFLVEARMARVERDFAADVAGRAKLLAELEQSRVQVSGGVGEHRSAREVPWQARE